MNRFSLATRMLLGRLLTRAGDQAWDFAVPIVLLQLMPGQLRIAALYYLLIKVASVIFLPYLSQVIDQVNRMTAAKVGIYLQLFGVIAGSICIMSLPTYLSHQLESPFFLLVFFFLVVSGISSQLGATFMDISIANDLVPSSFKGDELTALNSRLRQVDLLTEVASPIVAGTLMLITTAKWPLFGFGLIALWNVISFVPEYGILKSIFDDRPDLKFKPLKVDSIAKESLIRKLSSGWAAFFRQPVAMVVMAYSLLWLSVLSPHGVLLTGFLTGGWHMQEWMIGVFRGLGALFGLFATVLYPLALRKMSLQKANLVFLSFQAFCVAVGYALFLRGDQFGQIGFLGMILFSRIGLYGFSLGEMQIRQTGIPSNVRGEVNGFANALTAIATIGLFAAGVALPSTEDFKFLVLSSVLFVFLGLGVYCLWMRKYLRKR